MKKIKKGLKKVQKILEKLAKSCPKETRWNA